MKVEYYYGGIVAVCLFVLGALVNQLALLPYFYDSYCEVVYTSSGVSYDPHHPLFQKIAINLDSEREYNRKEYNCVNQSQELVRRLQAEGYQARTVTGTVYDSGMNETNIDGAYLGEGGRHMWVETTIYIEATSGRIISPEEYSRYIQDEENIRADN